MKKSGELPLETFLVVSIAGVTAHNLIDYNLQFVAVALPFWMCIGLLMSRPYKGKPGGVRRRVEIVLALALLLFTLFEGANLVMSSRARAAEARGNPLQSLTWYALTDRSLFPRDAWLSRGAMLLALNQLPQAEEAVDRALGYNEEDGRAWRLLGDIYLRWNKRQDSLRAYEKAYDYAKYDDIGITRGLIYLLKDQDADEFTARRHEFDMLLNEFGLAIEQNTHFVALGRNVEDLVALCSLLADIYPEDADAYHQLARRSQVHANEERAKTASRPRGLLW
jgi:tetratricopeptide (TPR) repeat protein